MSKDKEFKWAEMKAPMQGGPITGEIAIVNLPVKVLFEWSDKIVEDVDEENNPVSYKSGYLMRVIPDQTFVYENEKRITCYYGNIEC